MASNRAVAHSSSQAGDGAKNEGIFLSMSEFFTSVKNTLFSAEKQEEELDPMEKVDRLTKEADHRDIIEACEGLPKGG